MRILAIILAAAYLVGVAWFMPGRNGTGANHQVSVELATTQAPKAAGN